MERLHSTVQEEECYSPPSGIPTMSAHGTPLTLLVIQGMQGMENELNMGLDEVASPEVTIHNGWDLVVWKGVVNHPHYISKLNKVTGSPSRTMTEPFLWPLLSTYLRGLDIVYVSPVKVCAITVHSPQKPTHFRVFQMRGAQEMPSPGLPHTSGCSRTVTARQRDIGHKSCGAGVRNRRRRGTAEDKSPCSIREGGAQPRQDRRRLRP